MSAQVFQNIKETLTWLEEQKPVSPTDKAKEFFLQIGESQFCVLLSSPFAEDDFRITLAQSSNKFAGAEASSLGVYAGSRIMPVTNNVITHDMCFAIAEELKIAMNGCCVDKYPDPTATKQSLSNVIGYMTPLMWSGNFLRELPCFPPHLSYLLKDESTTHTIPAKASTRFFQAPAKPDSRSAFTPNNHHPAIRSQFNWFNVAPGGAVILHGKSTTPLNQSSTSPAASQQQSESSGTGFWVDTPEKGRIFIRTDTVQTPSNLRPSTSSLK